MVHIVNDLNLNLVKSELAPDSLGEPTLNNIVILNNQQPMLTRKHVSEV